MDAGTLVNWVRGTKSANELEFMRKAARIIEKTMQRKLILDTHVPCAVGDG